MKFDQSLTATGIDRGQWFITVTQVLLLHGSGPAHRSRKPHGFGFYLEFYESVFGNLQRATQGVDIGGTLPCNMRVLFLHKFDPGNLPRYLQRNLFTCSGQLRFGALGQHCETRFASRHSCGCKGTFEHEPGKSRSIDAKAPFSIPDFLVEYAQSMAGYAFSDPCGGSASNDIQHSFPHLAHDSSFPAGVPATRSSRNLKRAEDGIYVMLVMPDYSNN